MGNSSSHSGGADESYLSSIITRDFGVQCFNADGTIDLSSLEGVAGGSEDSQYGGNDALAASVGIMTGGAIGGLSGLAKDYDQTVSSKAKKNLIRKLAVGISKAMNAKKPKEGASSDELVAHLVSIVPNPRTGHMIVANEGKQAKLCKDVADVVNANYGKVIDKSLGANGICNQVADIVNSLSAGLNSEYITVAASVQRNLQNTREIKEMLSRSYDKMYNAAMNSSDDSLKLEIEGIKTFHDLILNEMDRQTAILANLTGTILSDTSKDIVNMLEKNKDFKGLVASLKSSTGSSEWGIMLANWLGGINNVAQIANKVDKALKVIGMKVSDYKSQHKLSDLIMRTQTLMEKTPKDKMTREHIKKTELAIDFLKRHHNRHSEIIKKLKSGGSCGMDHPVPGGIDISVPDAVDGGYTKLKKKLKSQKKTHSLILKDFRDKSKTIMDRVYKSVFNIAMGVRDGKIRLSDELHHFKSILGDVQLVFRDGIEYALTGYHTHANAVEHKNRFLGLIKAMSLTVEELKSQSESFKNLSHNLEAMIKLVDFFSDKFKIYGSTVASARGGADQDGGFNINKFADEAKARAAALAAAAKKGINDATEVVNQVGESASQLQASVGKLTNSGGGEFKAAVTLKNATSAFSHAYNIAKFKVNLASAAQEMQHYNKNYTTLVGVAVGKEVDSIRSKVNEIKKNLEDDTSETGAAIKHISEAANAAGYTALGLESKGYTKGAIVALTTSFANAKVKLYKVAQAVDLYLQHFTDAVAASPDDIREVSKMLSSVELMANWFNNKSGNSITAIFEAFPWDSHGFKVLYNAPLRDAMLDLKTTQTRIADSSHYYSVIGKHLNDKAQHDGTWAQIDDNATLKGVGNPFIPISPVKALQVHKFAKYAVEKVYALKNIISAFAYLGNKFGGKELHKETFMSPNDIYKALMEYIYISALTMGWSGGDNYVDYGGADYGNDIKSLHTDGIRGQTASQISGAAKQNEFTFFPHPSIPWSAAATADRAAGNIQTAVNAGGANIALAAGGGAAEFNNGAIARKNFGVVMSGIQDTNVDNDHSLSGWKSLFRAEDKMFVHIVKSMAAKVFTVTGLYNMLNYADRQNYAMNPTRLILGGGSRGGNVYQTPKIHSGAMELYARLPLLAEFYRDIFRADDGKVSKGSTDLLVSMVPEVGSTWSGFIRCIFDQPASTDGLYTENVLKKIVHEINEVYLAFKGKHSRNVVSAVINDFVAEINSRYGVVSLGELSDYKDDINSKRNTYTYGNPGDLDEFDILDSDELGSGVAPSDRFSKVTGALATNDHKLDPKVVEAMMAFRKKIDARMHAVTHETQFGIRDVKDIPDFTGIIISAKESLKYSDDPNEQFKIATRMMVGMDVRTQTDQEVNLMFHETIVAPLNMLSSVTDMLMQYEQQVREWDAYSLYKGFEKSLDAKGGVDGSMGDGYRAWAGDVSGAAVAAGADWATWVVGAAVGNAGNASGVVNGAMLIAPNTTGQNEMHRCMDISDSTAQNAIRTKIEDNLVRNDNATFPAGFMGLPHHATLADITNTIDLKSARHIDDVAFVAAAAHPGAALITQGKGYKQDKEYGPHRLLAYAHIRWEALFKKMTALVYGLTSDLGSMCEVGIQNHKMIVNHTKLQSICEEVLANTRRQVDKFRGIVDSKLIERCESQSIAGSMGWVQEHLIDGLFYDRERRGLKRAHNIVTRNFELIANRHPDSTGHRVTYFGFNDLKSTFAPLSGMGRTGSNEQLQGWPVESAFAELSHYASRTLNSDTNNAYESLRHPAVESVNNFASRKSTEGVWSNKDELAYLMQDLNDQKGPNQPTRKFAHHLFKARSDLYLQNTADGRHDPGFRGDSNMSSSNDTSSRIMHSASGDNRDGNSKTKSDVGQGLMMKLNEVMAAYMRQFWDTGANKIYAPLIEVPANGVLNQSVFKAQGWPDLVNSVLASTQDPNGTAAAPGSFFGGIPLNNDDDGKHAPNSMTDLANTISSHHLAAGAVAAVAGAGGNTIADRVNRYHNAALLFQNVVQPLFAAGWAATANTHSAKYGFPAIADHRLTIQATHAPGLIAAAGPLAASAIGADAIMATSLKYLHRLKRAIVMQSRIPHFINVQNMRTFVYNYINTTLSEDIYVGNTNRLNAILRLSSVHSASVEHPAFEAFSSYRKDIHDRSNLVRAFVVEEVLLRYANTIFSTFQSEIALAAGLPVKGISDIVAVASLASQPINVVLLAQIRAWAGVMVTNDRSAAAAGAAVGRVNALALSLYSNGCTLPLSDVMDVVTCGAGGLGGNAATTDVAVNRVLSTCSSYEGHYAHNHNQAGAGAALAAAFPATLSTRLIGLGISANVAGAAPIDAFELATQIGGGNGSAGANAGNIVASLTAAGTAYNRIAATVSTVAAASDLDDSKGVQSLSTGFACIGDPVEVLFASTAKAMRTALTETGRNGEKSNVIQTIAEVPPRMKEIYKAQLPIFCELFKMISKKADLLKNTLNLGICMARPFANDRHQVMEVKNVHGPVLSYRNMDHKRSVAYYTQLLDRIANVCESMCSTAKGVIGELNDSPLFAEVAENSITNYKNNNKRLPYMPLSHVSQILQHAHVEGMSAQVMTNGKVVNVRNGQLGYPVGSSGSDLFAFNYATRQLLHSHDTNPLMEHMPGMVDILDKYNMSARGQRKMEKKAYESFASHLVKLMRYVSSTRLYSPLFGSDRNVVDRNLVEPSTGNESKALNTPVYQMTLPLSGVISLTTSSDHDSNMNAVITHMITATANNTPISRNASMVYNLLDLNISAINVHALRKDVPLANIYNYSCTFDAFVSEVIETSVDSVSELRDTSTTHEMLALLCKHPYMRLNARQYYGTFGNIAKGRSSIDFYGRPKFISDQIWNKALFNSINGDNAVLVNTDQDDRRGRRNDAILSTRRVADYNNAWYGIGASPMQQLQFLTPNKGETDTTDVKVSVNGGPSLKGYLRETGRLRFDTKLIRNLVFLTNVQRMMTHKIDTELSKMPFPVASNRSVTNRKLTDYHDMETMDDISID
jgi:hypothetical protein